MIDNHAYHENDIRRMLASKEGRDLVKLLQQSNAAALQQAAAAFQRGDAETAKKLLAPLMDTEQAQAFIRSLNQHG